MLFKFLAKLIALGFRFLKISKKLENIYPLKSLKEEISIPFSLF